MFCEVSFCVGILIVVNVLLMASYDLKVNDLLCDTTQFSQVALMLWCLGHGLDMI